MSRSSFNPFQLVGDAARALGRTSKRFIRDEDGTNAIEFAFVAVPFFALIAAIVEASMAFFAGQVMDTGLRNAARLIRTGQAQAANYSATQFKQQVCNQISGLLDCASGLTVDVRVPTTFSSADFSVPSKNGSFDPSQVKFNMGASGSIVVARAFYNWPSFTNILGATLSKQGNNTILLVSTAAFKNEPF